MWEKWGSSKSNYWLCFLTRYRALYPMSSTRISKQWDKSLLPKSCDLGLQGCHGDVASMHSSVLLCHHVCSFVGLWKHWDTPIVKASVMSYSSPFPVFSLFTTLHWLSQNSHLRQRAFEAVIYCGYCHCFSQNSYHDSGIQGHETRKNHEAVTCHRSF